MNELELINIKSPILLLKSLSDGNLAILDAQNTLRIINPNTRRIVDGFKSNISHKRFIGSHVDVSLDGKYSICVIPGSNKAAFFSVAKKELLYKIGRHQGEIESVAIDPNSRYCVTCGQDGKAFVWVLQTAHLAFSLPMHSDFITTVAFNDTGQWIATGSYDRTINFFNMATMKNPLKFRGHNSVIVKIAFLSKGRLLSAEKNGALIVWDIHSGKILYRLPKINDEITTLSVSNDKRFAFVGTKPGYISLYDLEKMELLKLHYLKASQQITSIAFIAEGFRLAVGTTEGIVRIYSLFDDQKHFMQMVIDGQYKSFYEAVNENPILLYSKPYEEAERIWNTIIDKARASLEYGEREKAKEIFAPFSTVPKKNLFIRQILSEYEKYDQFKTYVEEKRYSLAYSIAKQHPSFKESQSYLTMESRWRKLFAKAQEVILEDHGEDLAREILAPFRGISEKSVLIQQLFEQREMYKYFKKVIAQHDFVKFFYLVKMHPFLTEFPEYNSVIDYADKLYVQAQKAYMQDDYSTVKKCCEVLIVFPDYSDEAHQMLDAMKAKHLFIEAIQANNLINAFSYLSLYPLLYEMPEAQILEKQWNLIVDEAQRYAAKGLVKETTAVFEPYHSVKDKYPAMGAVYAQCYSVQLKQKLRKKAPRDVIEYGIRQYVSFFGIDEMISQIYEYYNNLYPSKLSIDTLKQGSLSSWAPSMVVSDITSGN